MARQRDREARAPLQPLPPESRTVGQLVAETLRLYGRRFWRALPLGLSLALLNQASAGRSVSTQVVILAAFAPLLTASYVAASALVAASRPPPRVVATALAAGTLAFLPVPLLSLLFALPAVAWLALVGLVVPVAVIERIGFRPAFGRAVRLARADYVHALGSLATLTIVFALTRLVLVLLLRGTGDQTERIAVFLADLVLGPVLFLGAALLYYDQSARSTPR